MCALLAEADELHRLHLPWMFQTPSAEPRSEDFFERLHSSEQSTVLVAESDARVVGVATAVMRTAPDFAVFVAQKWAVLDNIAVSESWRRLGVGSALIRDAERWAQAQGASWLELGVYEFNEQARAFYQSLGYAPVLTKYRRPL